MTINQIGKSEFELQRCIKRELIKNTTNYAFSRQFVTKRDTNSRKP
jgi:hypothetical protein